MINSWVSLDIFLVMTKHIARPLQKERVCFVLQIRRLDNWQRRHSDRGTSVHGDTQVAFKGNASAQLTVYSLPFLFSLRILPMGHSFSVIFSRNYLINTPKTVSPGWVQILHQEHVKQTKGSEVMSHSITNWHLKYNVGLSVLQESLMGN